MRNWTKVIDLKKIWKESDNTEPEFIDWVGNGRDVAKVIRKTPFFKTHKELEKIAASFEKARGEKTFNNACTRLWDWGDENDCWIRTVF